MFIENHVEVGREKKTRKKDYNMQRLENCGKNNNASYQRYQQQQDDDEVKLKCFAIQLEVYEIEEEAAAAAKKSENDIIFYMEKR